MLLRFKDRTWILLGKLIDKGQKEGIIRHIEIPRKDWDRLRREWDGLGEADQKSYMQRFKVVTEDGLPMITPDMVMDEGFVDNWVSGKYDIYYRDVKLVPDSPEWTAVEEEEKATAETEKLG